MQFKSLKGFSGTGSLGMLLVFFGLGFILAGGAQLLIGLAMLPASIPMDKMGDAMLKAMMDPKNVGLARLSQVLGTFFLMFLPAVLYSLIVNGKNKIWLGFSSHINGRQILIGFFIIFVSNLLASPLADITHSIVAHFPAINTFAKNLEDTYNEQVIALSNLKSWGEFIMAIIIMAFFPALFEEIFFRGAIQNLLEKWWKMPLLAIIVSSLIFSLIHFSVYLFLSRAVLGFVLGFMYYKTRNIWVNVIAHFLNNAIAVSQLFYLSSHNKKIEVDKMDPKLDWWVGIVAIGILIILFKLLERFSEINKARIIAKEQVLLAVADPFHSFAQNENN